MGDDAPPSEEERLSQALGWACAHINRRERSVAEVRAQLERRGVAEATAEAALVELVEQGLLDDARFASMYVADKRTLESWGSERIRRGLHERGIDRELAEQALCEADTAPHAGDPPGPRAAGLTGLGGAGDASGRAGDTRGWDGGDERSPELRRALELLRRRFPDPPRDRRDRDRALGMLLRKGYEPELALDALTAHARG